MTDHFKKIQQRSIDLLNAFQLIEKDRLNNGVTQFQVNDLASRGANLIHSVTGSKSSYAENMRNALKQKSTQMQFLAVAGVLQGFHLDIAHGHLVNIRQEVEAVVVSEILSQAHKLSRTKGMHPAAAVIVACAGAEEFLRNWCEQKSITVPEKQRSIARFAQELRTAGHIELPVERRICAWADYRNDAAHGANWGKITQEIANRVIREIEDFVLENRHILG
ncbi:hypothetical protein ACQKFS_16820 [Pseudomonas guineae]|uniref:hypothetical protein n=1 Tax=Pseudomonas guineae TaxID=425504 RepID=UPI003CFE3D51